MVGVNYEKQGETLKGCVNDAVTFAKVLVSAHVAVAMGAPV